MFQILDKEKLTKLTQKETLELTLKFIKFAYPTIISVNYLLYNYVPWPEIDLETPIDRIIHTLQWHTLSVAVLWNCFRVKCHSVEISYFFCHTDFT